LSGGLCQGPSDRAVLFFLPLFFGFSGPGGVAFVERSSAFSSLIRWWSPSRAMRRPILLRDRIVRRNGTSLFDPLCCPGGRREKLLTVFSDFCFFFFFFSCPLNAIRFDPLAYEVGGFPPFFFPCLGCARCGNGPDAVFFPLPSFDWLRWSSAYAPNVFSDFGRHSDLLGRLNLFFFLVFSLSSLTLCLF